MESVRLITTRSQLRLDTKLYLKELFVTRSCRILSDSLPRTLTIKFFPRPIKSCGPDIVHRGRHEQWLLDEVSLENVDCSRKRLFL
jgi:hypothetical protein